MNLREYSKGDMARRSISVGWNHDDLQTGALLRVADAVEKISIPYAEILAENRKLQLFVAGRDHSICFLKRQNAGLRGRITRLKRELQAANDEQ